MFVSDVISPYHPNKAMNIMNYPTINPFLAYMQNVSGEISTEIDEAEDWAKRANEVPEKW